MSQVKAGIYQHYKGNKYQVIKEITDASNKAKSESLVLYQDLKSGKTFARNTEEFLDSLKFKGEKVKRFTFLSESPSDDWEQKYLRALADYQNLLKQHSQDKIEYIKYALSNFLHEILPVYDHLKIALSNLEEKDKNNPWAEGVIYVLKQFQSVLNTHGVEEIKTVGEKFDHNLMEATAGEGDLVTQEVQAGYKLNGRVIRPAKVVVSLQEDK